MTLTGAAKVAGVMGRPVAHSLSPRLHSYWLETLGIDGAYVPFAVRPLDLEAALGALRPLGMAGVNLTVPHKERALPFMDDLDEAARAVGAANTVIVERGGGLTGRNTDVHGFLCHLKASIPDWRPGAGPAVILGAGGAARAAVYALRTAGVPEIRIVNRTPERGAALLLEMDLPSSAVPPRETRNAIADAALLVNATSLGMTGAPPLDLDVTVLPGACVVYDLVYAPLETVLLASARRRGHACVDGLGMLIHQAVPAFEAFFGVRPPVTAAVRKHLTGEA